MTFPISKIRDDFPILKQIVNNNPLVYFDNGATTQKPELVINIISDYYKTENSNVHRGAHSLSQNATELFENARKYIGRFINAKSEKEIIFTKGTTESINLVASSISDFIMKDDEIVVTAMEHHSNLVPWQQLCERQKAKLRVIPINKDGSLNMKAMHEIINSSTKLVAIAHVSNVLGTINPIKEITKIAHGYNAAVLIDGAQGIAHVPVDVADIACDFYAFSAHKAYGSMGAGVLYGKSEWLNKLPPYQYGGEMISNVTFGKTTFNELPYKFEAGTPNVAGALGMESALRYIKSIGINSIQKYEDELLEYATNKVSKISGLHIVGQAKEKTAVLSFVIDGVHPFDIGTLLDQLGVAIRTGNHCAQPLVESMGLTGTIRASFGIYNTFDEIDLFVSALEKVVDMLM